MYIFTSISGNITFVFFKNMAQNTKLKTRGLILTLILNDVFFFSLFSFIKVTEKESLIKNSQRYTRQGYLSRNQSKCSQKLLIDPIVVHHLTFLYLNVFSISQLSQVNNIIYYHFGKKHIDVLLSLLRR